MARERAGEELPEESTGGERLVATAARCWQGLCNWRAARAYAVGIYSGKHESNSTQKGDGKEGVRLLLQMCRDLRGDTVANHLRQELRAAGAPAESVARLSSAIDLGRKNLLKAHSVFELYIAPGGETVALTDGRVRCLVDDSGKLSSAILRAFLGESSFYAKHSLTRFEPSDAATAVFQKHSASE